MYGKLGVNLFVLISGYFLCTSKFSRKRLVRLELEVIFYSATIGFLFYSFHPANESLEDLIKDFTPLMSERYGFYTTYFILMLFSPFINILIENIKKEDYRKMLLTIAVLWVIIPALPKCVPLQMSSLCWFVALYLFAGYVKKYPEDFNRTVKFYLLIGLTGIFLICLSVLSYDILGIYHRGFQNKFLYFTPMNSILIFLASIGMFIGFSKWKVGSKSWINMISSITFGVYLIHDNHLLQVWLWQDLFKNSSYINSSEIFLHAITVISAVYVACVIIDIIRQRCLEKPFFIIVEKIKILCKGKNT